MVSLLEHSLVAVIICSIIYMLNAIIVIIFAVKATYADPTDPVIYA